MESYYNQTDIDLGASGKAGNLLATVSGRFQGKDVNQQGVLHLDNQGDQVLVTITPHLTQGPAAAAQDPNQLSSTEIRAACTLSLQRSSQAGSIWILGVPLSWEATRAHLVSWFPAGAATSAVASPAPGSRLRPHTPITLTFSKPVAKALGGHLPPVVPNTPGTWRHLNSHSIVFRPTGYGYGLGAKVGVALPAVWHSTVSAASWLAPRFVSHSFYLLALRC